MCEDDEDSACCGHYINEIRQKASEALAQVRYKTKTKSDCRLMVAFASIGLVLLIAESV